MSKYIDADKLIAEIERLDEKYRTIRVNGTIQEAKEADLVVHVLLGLSNFVSRNQQEQPEIKSYIEKLLKECVDDPGEYYRGRRETLAHLFYHLGGNPLEYLRFIKQPEVDLEKEIEEHALYMPHGEFASDNEIEEDMEWAMKEFRHFYELGLNARKEE